MKLDKSKCEHLDRFTKDFPGKPIKYYVYKMTPSTVVKNKSKMVRKFASSSLYGCGRYTCTNCDACELQKAEVQSGS